MLGVLGWFLIALLGVTPPLRAHPAVSVVRDSRGNIFYSDISRVWRLTPDGAHTVFIPGVHTHELALDAQDRLSGEHLWYDATRPEPWQHYLWRATPDGTIERLSPDTAGFRRDHSFARDRSGRMYWAERLPAQTGTVFRAREVDGTIRTIARSSALTNVRWLTCSADGTLYFIHDTDLVRCARDGRLQILARQLAESPAGDPNHQVQGLCADDTGLVHAAVAELGVIKRITPQGAVTIVDRSTPPWKPSGVLAGPTGELWVLEYDPANRMRLRHVRPDGSAQIHGP